jgi:hypothetical protein
MALKTHRRSWSTAYLRFQSLHKLFSKRSHSEQTMQAENESSPSQGDDSDSASSLGSEFNPKICQKCISSVVTSDPSTLEGQQEGAIMTIKSITNCSAQDEDDLQPQVGDHVMVLRFDAGKLVIVKNLRGFLASCIPWANFFPVPYFGKCICFKGHCRCIYESEEEFYVRQIAR